MPASIGGQLTIILGIFALLIYIKTLLSKGLHMYTDYMKHVEWTEEMWLEKCRRDGTPVSDELIKKHMKINGNSKKSSAEKDRIYGVDRPREHESNGDLSTAKVKTIL